MRVIAAGLTALVVGLSGCGGGGTTDASSDTASGSGATTGSRSGTTGSGGGSDTGGGATGSGGGNSGSGTSATVFFPAAGSGPITQAELDGYRSVPEENLDLGTAALPGSTSATYDGLINFAAETVPSDGPTYFGRATLTADFTAGTVTGTTTNYTVSTGIDDPNTARVVRQVAGSIPLTNATLTGAVFEAEMNGALNDNGQLVTIATDADGVFVISQSGRDALAVGLVGTIDDGAGAVPLDGAIVSFRR